MTVRDIADRLGLRVYAADETGLSRQVTGGYCGDLLSCAMAGARAGQVWVTLQAHRNVVAVATLAEVACVIITEGAQPDEATVQTAERERVVLLGSGRGSFAVVADLVRSGVPG